MKKNHNHEVVTGRKRVIAMSILQGAKTPEEIAAVARSIGEGTLGNDAIVLKVMSDYWAADAE